MLLQLLIQKLLAILFLKSKEINYLKFGNLLKVYVRKITHNREKSSFNHLLDTKENVVLNLTNLKSLAQKNQLKNLAKSEQIAVSVTAPSIHPAPLVYTFRRHRYLLVTYGNLTIRRTADSACAWKNLTPPYFQHVLMEITIYWNRGWNIRAFMLVGGFMLRLVVFNKA